MTVCPYCSCDQFTADAIRADKINDGYLDRYGYWFNQCCKCYKWSLYKDDQQYEIDNPTETPTPHSIESE